MLQEGERAAGLGAWVCMCLCSPYDTDFQLPLLVWGLADPTPDLAGAWPARVRPCDPGRHCPSRDTVDRNGLCQMRSPRLLGYDNPFPPLCLAFLAWNPRERLIEATAWAGWRLSMRHAGSGLAWGGHALGGRQL